MAQTAGGLDKEMLEEVFRDVLKSVLGNAGTGPNPRLEFYNKFQREMEEHDRDFERKYDEDLNTTLIFSGLFSAVTSAFIIDLQSDLKPDYQQMNNVLLEMLLNATTGSLPADSVTSIPRWSGPDPVVVQVQSIFYMTLSATLLASFLAMLGKQWLNRYRQNETRGSAVDRSRVHERKLTGIETWKFRFVMEALPLILQCALLLLGFALSRYLWDLSRTVSSVVIGFVCFGLLLYLLIIVVSVFSFDCPFQTPPSLLIRFLIDLALPHLQNLSRISGRKEPPPEPGTPGARHDSSPPTNAVGSGRDLEASIAVPGDIALAVIQSPESVSPLFYQKAEAEADRLDARCVTRMFVMSTDSDVVVPIMDFIPEIIWHSGIKDVPLKRIYGILVDCFNFSGPLPVVVPKMRDAVYLSARAFTHVTLQRRCITQYEEDKQDSWKALCESHVPLFPTECGSDSDLKAVLSMVDMTLGHDNGFSWKKAQMTPIHREWMAHVFLYRAWCEGKSLSGIVMDFVETSLSLRPPPNDVVTTDCLFIIGLMVGLPIHISDITVRDKSRGKQIVLEKVFGALSAMFTSSMPLPPLGIHALRLATRSAAMDVAKASYELFKAIVAPDNLTDEDWKAVRLALHGAFQKTVDNSIPPVGNPKEVLKFLDYHLGLQGAGEDHRTFITFALMAIVKSSAGKRVPSVVEGVRKFNCATPSFVKGMRAIMHPSSSTMIRALAISLLGLVSDQWFGSPTPVMEPKEMAEFCKHLATYMLDDGRPQQIVRKDFFSIFFGMLRSPEWRSRISNRVWGLLAHWPLIEEEESFEWCLGNAVELLEFTRGLPDGEGFKWWYGALWFHFDKLDATVRSEVERIARDMSSGDGLSDLNMYLNLIGQEAESTQRKLDELTEDDKLKSFGMKLRARYVTLDGTHHRLARIAGRQ